MLISVNTGGKLRYRLYKALFDVEDVKLRTGIKNKTGVSGCSLV